MGQLLPRQLTFFSAGERKNFSALGTDKQPAASAPGAIHLSRCTDECVRALAVRNQIVTGLGQKETSAGFHGFFVERQRVRAGAMGQGKESGLVGLGRPSLALSFSRITTRPAGRPRSETRPLGVPRRPLRSRSGREGAEKRRNRQLPKVGWSRAAHFLRRTPDSSRGAPRDERGIWGNSQESRGGQPISPQRVAWQSGRGAAKIRAPRWL
jgi:hypothetical protein